MENLHCSIPAFCYLAVDLFLLIVQIIIQLPLLIPLQDAEIVELVGDVDEFARFDLAMARFDPAGEARRVDVGMLDERGVHGVDDEVEKVGFIVRVASSGGKDKPVGATGIQHLHTGFLHGVKEVAACVAVTGWLPVGDAFVHGAVIEGFDVGIEHGVDGRLEDGAAVEVDGEVEARARREMTGQARQGRGEVDQIEKGVGNDHLHLIQNRLGVEEVKEVGCV